MTRSIGKYKSLAEHRSLLYCDASDGMDGSKYRKCGKATTTTHSTFRPVRSIEIIIFGFKLDVSEFLLVFAKVELHRE